MKRLPFPAIVIAFGAVILLNSAANGAKPVVFASNHPLAYFAERIGGRDVAVKFPASGAGDPAYWRPADRDVSAMQNADLILLNGAAYEKWLSRVSLPDSILLDTSKAFRNRFIRVEHAVTHSHGADGEHTHAGTAFTTWLDFTQARQQAEAVRDGLIRLKPEAKGRFESRASELLADLDELDAEMRAAAKQIGNQPLVASHPVYAYFARRYGLNVKSVHWEPKSVPDEKAMQELQSLLEGHPAKWMIWEGDPASRSKAKLKEIGVQSVVFEPAGDRSGFGDWLGTMRKNVKRMSEVR